MTVRRWISRFVTAAAVLAAWTSSLAGQDPAERRVLLQQVIERFIRNYQTQAGLTDEQAAQFQQTLRQSMEANAKLRRDKASKDVIKKSQDVRTKLWQSKSTIVRSVSTGFVWVMYQK